MSCASTVHSPATLEVRERKEIAGSPSPFLQAVKEEATTRIANTDFVNFFI